MGPAKLTEVSLEGDFKNSITRKRWLGNFPLDLSRAYRCKLEPKKNSCQFSTRHIPTSQRVPLKIVENMFFKDNDGGKSCPVQRDVEKAGLKRNF